MRPLLDRTNARTSILSLDTAISERIRVLALTQVLLALLLVFFDLVTWHGPQIRLTGILACPALLITSVLYLLRRTRYAEPIVYLNLTLLAALVWVVGLEPKGRPGLLLTPLESHAGLLNSHSDDDKRR